MICKLLILLFLLIKSIAYIKFWTRIIINFSHPDCNDQQRSFAIDQWFFDHIDCLCRILCIIDLDCTSHCWSRWQLIWQLLDVHSYEFTRQCHACDPLIDNVDDCSPDWPIVTLPNNCSQNCLIKSLTFLSFCLQ